MQNIISMKLPIEDWIGRNKFSKDVNILFTEAVCCYKVGANRVSLLFSYLAFMTILKERIIGGTKPKLFPQERWDKIILDLQNEDLWDRRVFEATQQQKKIEIKTKTITQDPIFNINNDLRLQIQHWKNRRNDCAHYKDNIIDTFHIECFWAFMESNMSKITIEGGMQSLINKIYKHFDPTVTPPDKDITPLVKEIGNSVERSNLEDFWKKLLNNVKYPEKEKLIIKSLEVNGDSVNDTLIAFIKADKNYLKYFLSKHPDKLLRFFNDEEEVRTFWNTQLASCNNILGLYASFLRNKLIPEGEIAEANKTVLSAISAINRTGEYSPTSEQHEILSENGILDTFKQVILNDNQFIGDFSFLWVNDRSGIISGIIKNFPPDRDIIMRLVEHYNQSKNSDWLWKRFDEIFISDSTITNGYITILQEGNITIPERLRKYFITANA